MTDALCACQAVLAGLHRGIHAFVTHGTTHAPYRKKFSIEDRQRRRNLSVTGE